MTRSGWMLLLGLVMSIAFHISVGQGNNNRCTPAVACSACIQAGGACAWCGDEDFKAQDKQKARCNFKSDLQTCQNITFPESIASIPVSGNLSLGPTVQIHPQSVNLKLRPGRSSTFKLSVRPAENYPVDLYYLMDLSNSMKDDLLNLKKLGSGIAGAIDKITSNYRLGFGSFVDKTVSPYVQPELPLPCRGCEATYGYYHGLDFTANANDFATGVNGLKTSGNIDTPEGGMDALMQVAVCQQELGWKPLKDARRIVVYVSDASPHIAGDGKLGGIVTPNDKGCHLSGTRPKLKYSKSNEMDYPSVGQLKSVLQDNRIIPIIAVTSGEKEVYTGLAEEWKNLGATIGTLESDSSNIVQLMRSAYQKISSTVSLNDDAKSYLQIEYLANCPGGIANTCEGVGIGEVVTFDVSIQATPAACSGAAKNETKDFKIRIPGFADVDVKVEVQCECDCEKPPLAKPSSAKCSEGNGTFACGQCNCNPGRFGETCSCTSASSVDDSLCRVNQNKTDDPVCSDRGSCICGKCECQRRQNPDEKITGTFCQCTNFICDRHEGKLCGGPGRGRCECNKCVCEGIWTGSNCGEKNCTLVEQDCVKNGVVCGGKGTCDCGICNCDTGYKGSHCEECPTCPGQCNKKKDCILCQAFNIGPKEVCANCSLNVIVVNRTIEEKCRFQDNDECFYVFTYGEDVYGNMTYTVQQTKKCYPVIVEEPNVLAIVLGTIGGIVLAGLIALLLWKLFVSAYDKFEYHKFEKERTKSNWEKAQNPLYKPSKQKYDNPAYVGQRE